MAGKRVLIQPCLIEEIEWKERLVHLSVTREKVKGSLPYDASITVDGTYAERSNAYYGLY